MPTVMTTMILGTRSRDKSLQSRTATSGPREGSTRRPTVASPQKLDSRGGERKQRLLTPLRICLLFVDLQWRESNPPQNVLSSRVLYLPSLH